MTSAGGDPIPERLRAQPTWLLSQANVRAHRLLTDGLGAADARGYHYRVLAALADTGAVSQADLGRATGLDRSDIAAATEELEARRFVRRRPDPNDRRRNRVSITAAGRRRLDRLERILAGVHDELLAGLSERERATLVTLLGRLQP